MTQHNAALRIKRLDERASLPAYKSAMAAGLDLAACLPRGAHADESVTIEPGRIAMIPTGLILAIPEGYEGQVRPRSGLATRHGVTVPNAPGTIDADYRGEAMVALINLGVEAFTVRHGDRVAQLVVSPVVRVDIALVETLDETDRGAGGFGSTGVGA